MSNACDPQTARDARPTHEEAAATLTEEQRTRALGCLMGAATGDALGAPYEFEPPIAASEDIGMIGGGQLGWEPGEWTDDTSMSVVILQVAAEPGLGELITSEQSLDAIAAGWYRWARETPDIGHLTGAVLGKAHELAVEAGHSVPGGADMHAAARDVYSNRVASAGNGGLMRCYSAVLPLLRAPFSEFLDGVITLNTLTHVDPDTIDAAIIWGCALRHAILTGQIDVRVGIFALAPERQATWDGIVSEALDAPPSYFSRNGWVQHALQGAISAVHHAGDIPLDKFERRTYFAKVLEGAVRAGYDTDTVASIAGALAGAAVGYKGVDPLWRRGLHGWPGLGATELLALGEKVLDRANAYGRA